MEEPEDEPIEESPIETKPRWWPAIVISACLAIVLTAIWSGGGDNQQERVLQTGGSLIVSFLLLVIWALIFSRFSKQIRLRLLFSLIGAFVLFGIKRKTVCWRISWYVSWPT